MEKKINNENFLKIIVSGPSGSGKTTIIKEFLKNNQSFHLSKSYTTREKRKNENDDEYNFISQEKFLEMKNNNEFIETEYIYGNYYGTLKIKNNIDTIFNIGNEGAMSIKNIYKDAILIFILPPSIEELKNRLNLRDETCPIRINSMYNDIENYKNFQYMIINYTIDQALSQLTNIISIYKHQNLAQNTLNNLLNK